MKTAAGVFRIGVKLSAWLWHSANMRLLACLVAAGCRSPVAPDFAALRNVEDARARLLAAIPEGREIAQARVFMAERGFSCGEALPSATNTHAIFCAANERAPAHQRGWEITLIERDGRLMDIAARDLRK